jgi:hypothetical protein
LTVPKEAFGTRWVYENPYTYEGNNCRIRVIVQYAQETTERRPPSFTEWANLAANSTPPSPPPPSGFLHSRAARHPSPSTT